MKAVTLCRKVTHVAQIDMGDTAEQDVDQGGQLDQVQGDFAVQWDKGEQIQVDDGEPSVREDHAESLFLYIHVPM